MEAGSARGAIPFIKVSKNKGFEVTAEAEAYLATLEGKKLGVLSVAGKYRTGKSFLMNKIVQSGDRPGFAVGPTVNSCTKGIWIWTETLRSENPDEPDLELVVLDTEGFGGINENQNHDNRIFIFSLVLSSLFIYNSIGSIDENALQTLSLIVNLAKNVQLSEARLVDPRSASKFLFSDVSHDVPAFARLSHVSALNDPTEEAALIEETFPFFLWVIRDFCLELKDAHGNPITSRVYFENALKTGATPNDGKNKVRTLLKHFFRGRDCVTMVRPVEREADLQNLDSLEEAQLRPEFLLQLKKTRKLVLLKTAPKRIKGAVVDGPRLAQLARAYVSAINAGATPSVDSAWNYILQFENEKKLRKIYSRTRLSRSQVRNQDEINSILESVFLDFETERIGSPEETEEVKRRFREEMRQELGQDCSRFVETLRGSVQAAAEEAVEYLKKEVLELQHCGAETLDSLTDARMEQVVTRFAGQADAATVRGLADRLFAQGKAEVLQVALHQMEKARTRETRVLAQQKEETERNLREINEQLSSRVHQIERLNEAERRRIEELVRENQKLTDQTSNMKLEREHLASQLQENQMRLRHAESRAVEAAREENARLAGRLEQLSEQLAEQESSAQKESVLLQGKLKFLEASLQKAKAEALVKEAEAAELRKKLAHAEGAAEELTRRLKVQSVTVPETHVLVEKVHWSEAREKAAGSDDLRENYEKVIREVIEERNMVQAQFEFLKENFDLEKNKNFRLLRDIHDKIARKETSGEAAEGHHKWSTEEALPRDEETIAEVPELSISGAVVAKTAEGESDKGVVLYSLEVSVGGRCWTLEKRFRDFFDLAVKLRRALRRVELPPSTKELWQFTRDIWGVAGSKSFPLEQRRLLLEKVARDLASLGVVRRQAAFRDFIRDENSKD